MHENYNRAQIAITGGTGFVGLSLAKYLSKRFEVRLLDLKPPDFPADFRVCDIRDKNSLIKNLAGCRLVINCAVIQVPDINERKRLGYEVNVQGVQNICEAVESVDSIKGLIHTGSWHVFGERNLRGVLNEQFGFHPDRTEDRARFYTLCKIAQESIIRIFADTSTKFHSVIRLGTVLGEAMPKETAANIFIDSALKGQPITPFKHTQHRPMLYVDINDVCRAFEFLASEILGGSINKMESPIIANLVSPFPLTIIELARIIRKKVIEATCGTTMPKIKIIDKGFNPVYSIQDKNALRVDISRVQKLLKLRKLTHPQESIHGIILSRLAGAS